MEMVEIHSPDLDCESDQEYESGDINPSQRTSYLTYDDDDSKRTRLLQRIWLSITHQPWEYFLLHDAWPPFVSYWALWLFGFGFWWGSLVQWLALIPLGFASSATVYVRLAEKKMRLVLADPLLINTVACWVMVNVDSQKTMLVGRSAGWAEEGNNFVERLLGLTFPSLLFSLCLLLVHLKNLDLLSDASWPVVLIPFWTQYLLFLCFPVISLFFHVVLRRSMGGVAPYECSWFYLLKWPYLVPTIGKQLRQLF